MTFVIVFALLIFWAFIQKAYSDATGEMPRSRGSLRRQRRKARKMGVPDDEVPHNYQAHSARPYKLPRKTEIVLAVVTLVLWAGLLWHD